MSELPKNIPLFILDSNESPALFIINYSKWVVDFPSFPSFECDFFIIASPKEEDLMLGYDFLYHFNAIIDWKNGLITYDSSNKDSSGIIPSTSNDFAPAVNSVALVCELKTPSLPSSVHIPSNISSQSLLPLRDEVFKELKDVGEDVAISSLHLFQGDMDLPPLSFHASLEEKWDEQEEPKEIETVLKALQSFLCFANFYCHFIKNDSKQITSLTSLLKINSPFLSNEEALSQFQSLKVDFTTSPIVPHFNPSLPTILETDAFHYALGAVLSQVNDSGKNPIVFDSHKLLPAELNYEVHDKELLGIVWALKHWREFLLSLSNSFEVLTDHASLQYFMSFKVLTHPQARWAEFLSEFHFNFTYSPGRLTTLPDALSHLVDKIQKEVWQDKDYKEILKQLARGESVPDYSLEPQAKLLLFKDRVVIPSNEELQLNILQKRHNSPFAGHPGQEKTLNLIKRDFYLAGMNQFIKDYVSSFQQCSRNKKINHKKFGLLKPLSIPSGPWNTLSMDFITQLPLSNNFDSILVVVDRFSKTAIFILAYGAITALDLAQIFISHVFSKHGLPVSIMSDRGSLFVSSFWTQLCQKLKISRDLSTAFHPETDGQTERVNQILEQYLWMYVSYHQNDWYTWLSLAEFDYNNTEHSSTKQSPFFTIYGRNSSFDSIHISQDSPAGKWSTKLQSLKQVVKEELESTIRRFKKYSDRTRAIPPDFQPGDKVWLTSKNINTIRPTKKLSERWL
ncbi:hypothetical protein O181_009861 [Austropuccinia psidii MF-1]|uniref:RNA-directed DNA polymerase n=1 Tax=Austropuccinia psidii MF-1 TaxID=1389203 RepID=A0A9Q3BQ03_9BASI|nr:hypothetical protein [Austropuccinia psidii MF-1]